MEFNVTQVFHFPDDGPAILSDITATEGIDTFKPKYVYHLFTFQKKNGTRKRLEKSLEEMKKARYVDAGFCRWIEDEELEYIERERDVFIFYKGKVRLATYKGMKGELVHVWVNDDKDQSFFIDRGLVMFFYHEFEEVGDGCQKCKCGRMITPKYNPKKGVSHVKTYNRH